jgi:hypothetical protein
MKFLDLFSRHGALGNVQSSELSSAKTMHNIFPGIINRICRPNLSKIKNFRDIFLRTLQ